MSSKKIDLRFEISAETLPIAGKVDWSKAPEWAHWATYRRSAETWIYWYAQEPKSDGSWSRGAHSKDVLHPMEEEVIIERRPEPSTPVEGCRDCGQSHEHQIKDYPLGAKVLALTKISRLVTKGSIGQVVSHCADGRATIAFDREPLVAHTFHYPESAITVWTDDPAFIPPFPAGVRLIIDVVFPREYRIGYEYKNVTYIPGTPSYYAFAEAMQRCWVAFCERFPQ